MTAADAHDPAQALDRFKVAVKVAKKFGYGYFFAQDCWELGFVTACKNPDNDGECEGYWFVDLHTPIPFKNTNDPECQAIAGEFTKPHFFEDCTCDEDNWDGDDFNEEPTPFDQFQAKVDRELAKELKKAGLK